MMHVRGTRQDTKAAARLSVTLLPSGTSTSTTKLLRFHSSRVSDDERAVIVDKALLQGQRMTSIVVLHPVRDNSLCNRLSDGVNLRSVATTRDADTDVDCRQILLSKYQDRFVDLVAERGGLDEIQRLAVDADEATALLCMRDSSSRLFLAKCLDSICSRHDGFYRPRFLLCAAQETVEIGRAHV